MSQYCGKCCEIVKILRNEINQLQERESKLKRINNTLLQVINNTDYQKKSSMYRQVKLQSQQFSLKEYNKGQINTYDSTNQSLQQNMRKIISTKSTKRKNSIEKMDVLMSEMLKNKLSEKKSMNIKIGKENNFNRKKSLTIDPQYSQVVIKVVNDRCSNI